MTQPKLTASDPLSKRLTGLDHLFVRLLLSLSPLLCANFHLPSLRILKTI